MKFNLLQVECAKCKIADACPRRGASPLQVPNSNKRVYCQLVNGYGRVPVPKWKLSPTSLAAYEKNGPCLTVAYIPYIEPLMNTVLSETVLIFSQPVKHPRETIPFNINLIYPTNPMTPKPNT